MKTNLLILIIIFSLKGFGQSVPNTSTFTLQDVVAVTGGASLTAAFSNATGTFDLAYVGSKNSLYNFRNYKAFAPIALGYLYNWWSATDARNITASGWHLPSIGELSTLITYVGGESIAGGHLKEASLTYWDTPNTGADNSSLFNARGSGVRYAGNYNYIKNSSSFWSSTESTDPLYAWEIRLNSSTATCYAGIYTGYYKNSGFSIRILKNSTSLTNGQAGTYTGNDGKVYPTICIGTQEWISCNLAETKYRDGSSIPTVADASAWSALSSGAKCAYNNDESNVFY